MPQLPRVKLCFTRGMGICCLEGVHWAGLQLQGKKKILFSVLIKLHCGKEKAHASEEADFPEARTLAFECCLSS